MSILSNFVALIPTCLKCQRDWRISLELNSWDRAQLYKEKEKFVLVNYVSHKKPHRKISLHKCRAVMAKKFTKKTDACTKLSFYSLNRNFLMFSLPLLSWVYDPSVLTDTDLLKTVTAILGMSQLLEPPPYNAHSNVKNTQAFFS